MYKNIYSFENPYRATAYGKPSCRDTRIHAASPRCKTVFWCMVSSSSLSRLGHCGDCTSSFSPQHRCSIKLSLTHLSKPIRSIDTRSTLNCLVRLIAKRCVRFAEVWFFATLACNAQLYREDVASWFAEKQTTNSFNDFWRVEALKTM